MLSQSRDLPLSETDMDDNMFDVILIGMALVTALFAAVALVYIRWDRQQWADFKRRHIIDDCPPELDDM